MNRIALIKNGILSLIYRRVISLFVGALFILSNILSPLPQIYAAPVITTALSELNNLVKNPGFEEAENGFAKYWYHGGEPGGSETIEPGGYAGLSALKVLSSDSAVRYITQVIGALEAGSTYELSTMFKTDPTNNSAWVTLWDSEWINGNGSAGKGFYINYIQGTGDWALIKKCFKIPETDDAGNSTASHAWKVIVYGDSPSGGSTTIYYDNVMMKKVEASGLPQSYQDIEEMPAWLKGCAIFTDGYPMIPANPDMVTLDYGEKKSGEFSLRLQGGKTRKNTLTTNLPVKPDTLYKIGVWMKIDDRVCYNYLDLNYPSNYSWATPSLTNRTYGIWSGRFHVKFRESRASSERAFDLVPELPLGASVAPSERGWFREEAYIRTSSQESDLTLSIELIGFDGKFWVDGFSVEEVESHIEDKYLHMPVEYEFEGMKIEAVSTAPLFVRTNAAKFKFSGDNIEFEKNGAIVSSITFEESGFLDNLRLTEEPGIVVLENGNIAMSIGADSSMLTKLKKDTRFTVSGGKPAYHAFEAGIIFATDYEKGVLFSPLYTDYGVSGMPHTLDLNVWDFSYNDADFEKEGLKNWEVISGFSNAAWEVRYAFKKGEGFIASIFPPKEFSLEKYYKERMGGTATVNLNRYPDGNYSYNIQKAMERSNIFVFLEEQYAYSYNDRNPPTEYYIDKNGTAISFSQYQSIIRADPSGAKAMPLFPVDSAGPWDVKEKEAFHRFVDEAHAKGGKVIVYMTPEFYYTYNVDVFLDDMRQIIEEFNLDGVYYDGLNKNPLKSLELVRKTRNILKDKILVLHSSSVNSLIYRSDHFRLPYEDVYADMLLVGEGTKKSDDDTWRFNYCGNNVSNTVSSLIPELRPINYSLPKEESIALSLSPEEQIDKQLFFRGTLAYMSAYDYTSGFYDGKFSHYSYYKTDYYWDKFDAESIKYTRGNGIRDAGETINNALDDCAPITNDAVLKHIGGSYECDSVYSVAQWLIDGTPLYRLHFTFDGDIARDDSEHRMSPPKDLGVLPEYPATALKMVESRRACEFNGSAKLFGYADRSLNLTGKNFSSFAAFKADGGGARQAIFSLNCQNFYYGIENSKAFVYARSEAGNLIKLSDGTNLSAGDWHTVGIVYELQALRLYVDGQKVGEIAIQLKAFPDYGQYAIGTSNPYYNADPFRGYIDDIFVADRAFSNEQAMQYHRTLHKNISLSGSDIKCVVSIGGKPYTAIEESQVNRPPEPAPIEDKTAAEGASPAFTTSAQDPNGGILTYNTDNAAYLPYTGYMASPIVYSTTNTSSAESAWADITEKAIEPANVNETIIADESGSTVNDPSYADTASVIPAQENIFSPAYAEGYTSSETHAITPPSIETYALKPPSMKCFVQNQDNIEHGVEKKPVILPKIKFSLLKRILLWWKYKLETEGVEGGVVSGLVKGQRLPFLAKFDPKKGEISGIFWPGQTIRLKFIVTTKDNRQLELPCLIVFSWIS